jgi:hypothetical protein
MNVVEKFYCPCGQPLALLVVGVPRTPYHVHRDTLGRVLEESTQRHSFRCPRRGLSPR